MNDSHTHDAGIYMRSLPFLEEVGFQTCFVDDSTGRRFSSTTTPMAPVHVLSEKSSRQRRNVFIWCCSSRSLVLGWHVDDHSPMTISAAYGWVKILFQYIRRYRPTNDEPYTLFPIVVQPSGVLRYACEPNGPALSRESQEIMVPGDYGVCITDGSAPNDFWLFSPIASFGDEKIGVDQCVPLANKTSVPPSFKASVLHRDGQCVFSGATQSDELVAMWIFPPYLGYMLSNERYLQSRYYQDPESCDFSYCMVLENTLCVHKSLVGPFLENQIGVDIDDNYRIVVFEGSEDLDNAPPLKYHLTVADGPHRPSDQFLRLHFKQCIIVSAYGGDVMDDYPQEVIDGFMEELGVFDNEIDTRDPKWMTPLGIEVYSYLVRDKLERHEMMKRAEAADSDGE